MYFGIGLFVAATAFFMAVTHLNQPAGVYYDFVAFVMVIGGTAAVSVITFPWQYRHESLQALKALFNQSEHNTKLLLAEAINFVRQRGGQVNVQTRGLPGLVLRDGAELISLGVHLDKIHEILETRVVHKVQRLRKVGASIRALAKYPPAFGLAGTVLGLVSLMRAVSAGADAKETGVAMAIALIATFYGIVVSNLLINPAGELIMNYALEEQKRAEIALQAVLLANSETNALEAQELLNSFVSPEDRIDVIASIGAVSGASA